MKARQAGARTLVLGVIILLWAVAMLALVPPRSGELAHAARTLGYVGLGLAGLALLFGFWLRTQRGRVL